MPAYVAGSDASLRRKLKLLDLEIERLDIELNRKAHARPLFRHCAARYLGESKNKRSVETIAWHVQLLLRYFGDLEPERIHECAIPGEIWRSALELPISRGVGMDCQKSAEAIVGGDTEGPNRKCRE